MKLYVFSANTSDRGGPLAYQEQVEMTLAQYERYTAGEEIDAELYDTAIRMVFDYAIGETDSLKDVLDGLETSGSIFTEEGLIAFGRTPSLAALEFVSTEHG